MQESKRDENDINGFDDEKVETYKSKLFKQLEEKADSKDDSGMDRIEKLCQRIPLAAKDCQNKFNQSYANFMRAMDGGLDSLPEKKGLGNHYTTSSNMENIMKKKSRGGGKGLGNNNNRDPFSQGKRSSSSNKKRNSQNSSGIIIKTYA